MPKYDSDIKIESNLGVKIIRNPKNKISTWNVIKDKVMNADENVGKSIFFVTINGHKKIKLFYFFHIMINTIFKGK